MAEMMRKGIFTSEVIRFASSIKASAMSAETGVRGKGRVEIEKDFHWRRFIGDKMDIK